MTIYLVPELLKEIVYAHALSSLPLIVSVTAEEGAGTVERMPVVFQDEQTIAQLLGQHFRGTKHVYINYNFQMDPLYQI